MKFKLLAATLLSVFPAISFAQDQYSLRLTSDRYTYGAIAGASSRFPVGKDQAILFKNGQEIIRIPVKALIKHAGVIIGGVAISEPEFAIENLNPQMTMRSLLTGYAGLYAAAGVGTHVGSSGRVHMKLDGRVKIGDKTQIVTLKNTEKDLQVTPAIVGLSRMGLFLSLNKSALTQEEPKELDMPIESLTGPHPDLLNKEVAMEIKCTPPNDFAEVNEKDLELVAPTYVTQKPVRRVFDLNIAFGSLVENSTDIKAHVSSSATLYTSPEAEPYPYNPIRERPSLAIKNWRFNQGEILIDESGPVHYGSMGVPHGKARIAAKIKLRNGKITADYAVIIQRSRTGLIQGANYSKEDVACEVKATNTRLSFEQYFAEYIRYRGWY